MKKLDPIHQIRSKRVRKQSSTFLSAFEQLSTAAAIKNRVPFLCVEFIFIFLSCQQSSLQVPYNFMDAVVRQTPFSPLEAGVVFYT